jgi:hypothetical protein
LQRRNGGADAPREKEAMAAAWAWRRPSFMASRARGQGGISGSRLVGRDQWIEARPLGSGAGCECHGEGVGVGDGLLLLGGSGAGWDGIVVAEHAEEEAEGG